jgi:hypothetical protein
MKLIIASRRDGTCRGCGAAIVWFQTLAGKLMPMNRFALARTIETDFLTGERIGVFDRTDSHWNCPRAERFRRR